MTTFVKMWSAVLIIVILSNWPAYGENREMKIILKMDNQTITATMEDNLTTREFISMLPLTLTLNDYSKTEKISGLPKKLTKEGAPAAITPKAGDVTIYAPWGNLAIFYRDGHHSPGLIKLGKLDSDVDAFSGAGSMKVTIEASHK